jgi:hypothetical protein
MLLVIILGYLGIATPLLLGMLRAAARGDRTAPVPERSDLWDHSAPSTLPSSAPAAR